ncbi:MAG: universal stress protein [Porticoccaceae bacterium]
MSQQERIFVVVNPTLDQQIALDRAIISAKLLTPNPIIRVFVAVDSNTVDLSANNTAIYRNTDWFEQQIHQPLKDAGLEYSIEISWSDNWQKSIMVAAKRFAATRIMIRAGKPAKSRRFIFAESKWALLKEADCPVLLVRDGAKPQRKTILAAVNFQASRINQDILNRNIIERGRDLAKSYNADFHVVNGYIDSMLYPDRGRLIKQTGLDAEKIHVTQGYTDEVIASVAKQIGADLVVIGTLGQTGLTKTRRGNTAERVISAVDVDVVVVNSINS